MDTKNEYGYFAKQVASELDITTSTLRRWSIELEKYNYQFERNNKDQRIYHERDFTVIRELKSLIADGVVMVDACKAVVETYGDEVNAQQTLSVQTDDTREMMLQAMQEMINQQIEKALEKQRHEYENYIDERLNKIDQRLAERDAKLMESLRESQQAKIEAKQAQIEVAPSQEQKRGFWQRLFNK